MTRRRALLTARRFPTVTSQRTVRLTSTTAQLTSAWKDVILKNKRVTYAAGGITVAILGLMWMKPDGSQYPDDPRDVKALSTVPLGKLFSGWM